jgi:hypothetical protein
MSVAEEDDDVSEKSSKLLKGCGIGCAVVLFLVALAATIGYVRVKQSIKGLTDALASHDQLVTLHGEVERHVPAADGSISAASIERFLVIRESLSQPQAEVEEMLADFPPDELFEDKRAWPIIRAALGMLGELLDQIGGYINARNQALIEAEMGLGEYMYIYSTAYYSWLGHSPEDAPVITKKTDPTSGKKTGEPILDDESSYSADRVRRRYRQAMLAMMRNQLAAIPEAGGEWYTMLADEIELLADRPGRIAWQEGLPATIEGSLTPYRERFKATYSEVTNPFEIPMNEEDWE